MSDLKEGSIVIIINTDNYMAKNCENIPFKAELYLITDYPCYWVRSLVTGRNYEVYKEQILEGLEIHEIANILDLSKYGS